MPAVNYQGKESEQSKARRKKPNKKPKPWYLGWGLAKFGGRDAEKMRKERDKAMADLKKE